MSRIYSKLALVALLLVSKLGASIAFNAKGSNQSAAAANNVNVSITIGSGLTNSKLIVGVVYYDLARHVSTVTYNGGTNLTFIVKKNNGVQGASAEFWYIDNPVAGAQTVAVTLDNNLAGAEVLFAGAYAFSGMLSGAGDTPVGTVVTGSHSSHSDSITPTHDNSWIIDVIGENVGVTAPTAGGSQANVSTQTSATGGSLGMSTLGPVTPAASTAMSWTFTLSSNASVHEVISFGPAPTGVRHKVISGD